MIWITGDKHGEIEAFQTPAYKKVRKKDTVIVCGDFGFVWKDSKKERKNLRWLSKRKYTIAFVEGSHENHERLKAYPEGEFGGGTVRVIEPNILLLQRGEVYNIEGKTFLTFGGGVSPDLAQSISSHPTPEEEENARKNIAKNKGAVDVVISHEAPYAILSCMESPDINGGDYIHDVLERIRKSCSFKRWFFGKHHVDKEIPPYYRAVFNDLIPLEFNEEMK